MEDENDNLIQLVSVFCRSYLIDQNKTFIFDEVTSTKMELKTTTSKSV